MTLVDFSQHQDSSSHVMSMLMDDNRKDSSTPKFPRVSGKLTVQCADKITAGSEAVDTVLGGISLMAEHQTEIRALEATLQDFVQAISDNMPEQFSHFSFTPILCRAVS